MEKLEAKIRYEFKNKELPSFGPEINIDYDDITYYKRIDNKVHNTWDNIDKKIKKTNIMIYIK